MLVLKQAVYSNIALNSIYSMALQVFMKKHQSNNNIFIKYKVANIIIFLLKSKIPRNCF